MRLLLLAFSLALSTTITAQLSFGLTGGLSTSDLSEESLNIAIDDSDEFRLQVSEARYGIHAGVFAIAQMDRFYLMPELIFNSNKVEYAITELDNSGEVVTILREEELQKLDIGLMMGLKLGMLRIGVGPVGHVHLDNVSQLWDIEGYDQNFDGLTWGFQSGVGLDLYFLHLDLRYEGNLSQFGDHIMFFGDKYSFDKRVHRWIARVGLSF